MQNSSSDVSTPDASRSEVSAKTETHTYRKLSLVVWVGMVAFLILASYGFYLVYNLTQSVAHLDRSVASIAENMATMTTSVNENLQAMTGNFSTVADRMGQMQTDTAALAKNLAEVTQTMSAMNQSIWYLRQDVGQMNQSVGRPMSFFSQFMPQSAPPPPGYYPAPMR